MRRRGSILLELMLALAIFVAFAIVCVRLMDEASMHTSRAAELSTAVDLCQSAITRLEAGDASATTLNGPTSDVAGEGWELAVRTEKSDVEGLMKVEVEALRAWGGAEKRSILTLRAVVPDGSGS